MKWLALAGFVAACGGAPSNGPSASTAATPATPTAEVTLLGRSAYTEFRTGALPIILTAPHGGGLRPTEIPDRTFGSTLADANTEDVLIEVAAALLEKTGQRPLRVICHLHRIKLDANREIVEAAQGSPVAEQAWTEYHAFIEAAKRRLLGSSPFGLLLDLHGHAHVAPRLELGYLLSDEDLNRSDAILAQPVYATRTSIRALAARTTSPFFDLIRGPSSLGASMAERGYASLPSPADPFPRGDPYFNGGYTTDRHGSRLGGTVDAIQIEANFAGVRDTAANRRAFAQALAESVLTFVERHYGVRLRR
jgi:N-formylglutamate amidohydrolase